MKKIWVVIANSGVSKIFRVEEANKLVEHACLENKESHMHAHEIMSDRLGHSTQRGHVSGDSYEEHTPLKVKESQQFANKVIHFLEEGFKNGEFDHLYLVVKPPFLGFLRQNMPQNIAKAVISEIHKDLTQMSLAELHNHLSDVL